MEERGLLIKPGGTVEFWKWSTEEGKYVCEDVTGTTTFHLMERVVLADGVTLRDIFKVAEEEIEIYSIIVNNWIEEYIAEAKTSIKPEDDDGRYNLDYLVMHWSIQGNNSKKKYAEAPIASIPDFSGWGKYDEPVGDKNEGYWGVDFCPMYALIDLPFKLDQTMYLTINDQPTMEFQEATYTLFQVIFGIFWELSFYGGPDSKSEKHQEIMSLAEEARKEHEARKKSD